MNILFICNNMPPMVDGVGDYTYNIASEFARHGHQAHVICRKRCEIRTDYEHLKVVPIVEAWNKATGKRIAQYIKENKIDVVSLQYVPHGFHPKGLPFGLIPCMKEVKKTGVRMMVFCHEVCIGRGKWYHIKQNVMAMCMEYITSSVIGLSNYVATSISHYKQRLNRLGIEDIAIMPIPSNIPNIPIDESQRISLRKTIAKDDEVVITLFGNRNFSNVLKAIWNLMSRGYKIKILALGKANASIPKGDSNIFYTGAREINELSTFMQVGDMMILPENHLSGCSLKSGSLSAAIQFNIPIISNKGFMTEPFLDQAVCYVCDNSSGGYEQKIRLLIDNADLRADKICGCRNLAERLTWMSTYEHYTQLIKG